MAENLDDETIRNLNETLRELNDQMDGLNRLLPSMVASLDKTGDGFKDQEQMMKKLGMTQEEYNKAIDQGIDLKEAERKADEQIARTKANLNAALANGVASLGSFKNALLNAEAGLAKYSDSLDKLGDGAIDLGKNFGLAGVAVGLLTKAVTSVAGASLKQAEAALKARDELVKVGNAGGITAKQTLEMGHAAGLTSKNLNLLTKPMVKAGEALAMIGGSATQGTETFKKLVDVGEDTRIKYRRLGLGVGELIEFQADYLNLQRASGAQLSSEEKTQAKLQANSLKYIDNLMALSNLTGKSVDQLKKEQDQAMATYRVQLYNLEFNKKIRDAEKAGDTALRDRLVAERNARNQFLQFVESNLGPTAKAQAEEFIASGGMVTETTAPLVQALRGAGVDITKFTKELQKGTDGNKVAAEFSQDYARGVETNLGNLRTSAALSEDVGKQFGGAVDTLGNINRITGQNQQEVLEQGRKNVASAKEAGKDAAADVAAAIESTERKTQQAIDQFLLQVNPLFKSFEATKAAAIALGVAAAAAAAALVILAKRAGMLSLPGSQPGAPPGTPPGGPSGTKGGLRSVRPGLAAGIGLGGAAVGLAGDYAAEKLGRETTGGKVASTLSAAGTGASIGATVGSIVPGVGTGIGALVGGGLGALYGGYQALTAGKGQEGAAGAAQKTAYQRQLDEANERNRKIQEATIAATKANTEELNKTGKNLQNLSSTVASNTEQAAKEQTTQLLAGQGIGEGIVMSTEQREAAAAAAGGQPAPGAAPGAAPETLTPESAGLVPGAMSKEDYFLANRMQKRGSRGRGTTTAAVSDATLEQQYQEYLKTFKPVMAGEQALDSTAEGIKGTYARIVDKDKGAGKRTLLDGVEQDLTNKAITKKDELIALYNEAMIHGDLKVRNKIKDILDERGELDNETETLLSEINKSIINYNNALRPVVAERNKTQAAQAEKLKSVKEERRVADTRAALFGGGAPAQQGGAGQTLDASGGRQDGTQGGSESSGRSPATTAPGVPAGSFANAKPGTDKEIVNVLGAGPGYTTVAVIDGKKQIRKGVRNWRNNNPGNLEFGRYAKSKGALGTDGRFAVFPTLQQGMQAKEDLLFGNAYKDLSIAQAISKYAPPNENNTEMYIRTVASATQSSPSTILSTLTGAQRQSFLGAINQVEGFKPGSIIEARDGGLVKGPESGYPATLHGTELISPLTPNSILEKLAQTPAQTSKNISEMITSTLGGSTNTSDRALQDMSRINYDMMNMLSSKLDSMIDRLGDSNSIQEKILRQTIN